MWRKKKKQNDMAELLLGSAAADALQSGDSVTAKAALRDRIVEMPRNAMAHLVLARLLVDDGEPRSALALACAVRELDPQNFVAEQHEVDELVARCIIDFGRTRDLEDSAHTQEITHATEIYFANFHLHLSTVGAVDGAVRNGTPSPFTFASKQ